jgi:hypothetical protein
MPVPEETAKDQVLKGFQMSECEDCGASEFPDFNVPDKVWQRYATTVTKEILPNNREINIAQVAESLCWPCFLLRILRYER